MKHLHEFGSLCYILNDKEPRGKFNAKCDEGVFLGYCTNNRAYRVYNKRTKAVMESINVQVDEYFPPSETFRLEEPHVVSVLEGEKTLNSPKDTPPSNDEENEQVLEDVRTIMEAGHSVIVDVRTKKDSLQ